MNGRQFAIQKAIAAACSGPEMWKSTCESIASAITISGSATSVIYQCSRIAPVDRQRPEVQRGRT